MEAGNDQKKTTGENPKIKQALEDAERMLDFASKGKIDDKTDLDCLKKLAGATIKISTAIENKQAIGEADFVDFYSQLAIMSHILYPVTSESLEEMEGMARHGWTGNNGKTDSGADGKKSRSATRSALMLFIFAAIVSVVSLLVTPFIFSYSAKGSNIVSRLDATMKDLISIKKELIEERKRLSPHRINKNSNSQADEQQTATAGAEKNDTQKIAAIIHHLEIKTVIFRNLIEQLRLWNMQIPGHWFAGEEQKKVEEEDECFTSVNHDDVDAYLTKVHECFLEMGKNQKTMEQRLHIKNTGLFVLQTVNGTVLPLLFGFCGASAFILKRIIQAIQAHTFSGIHCTTWLRIVLGTFCGFFLGYLGENNELMNFLASESDVAGAAPIKISQVSALTLSFIGGYSVDLLFSILNRFIYAVTNDDRYLPASEAMRRKVDVKTLLGLYAPNATDEAGEADKKGKKEKKDDVGGENRAEP
jgi:hypothetical protein